jgi:hypothetical protein
MYIHTLNKQNAGDLLVPGVVLLASNTLKSDQCQNFTRPPKNKVRPLCSNP